MRPTSVVLTSFLTIVVVATAPAQEGGIINKDGVINQDGQIFRPVLEQLNPLPPRTEMPYTIEGLPKDAKGERLTWDRAYTLAVVRSRDEGMPLVLMLDPKALDAKGARLGVADFARFRREFLADGHDHFRDPSARFYDLLARAQGINDAVLKLAASENLLVVARQLVMGESSALTQAQVDQVAASLQRTQLDLTARQRQYRDALDEFKVDLGLSTQAPVWLDQAPLAKFRDTFESAVRWSADPSRGLEKLSEIASEIPPLGDFLISGRSILQVASTRIAEGEDPEAVVNAASRLAIANPGPPGASRELIVRKRSRKLAELATEYWRGQREFVLIMRQRSMAQERLFAPPQSKMDGAGDLSKLAELQEQLLDCENRLVEAWTSYHSLRLALSRDLNLLPVDNWKAFYDQMLGGKGSPSPVNLAPQPSLPR